MALHDDAVLNVGRGYLYLAPVGTAFPDDPSNVNTGQWRNVGHTSADEVLSITTDGGETTTLATLQAKTLRQTQSAKTVTFGIQLAEFKLSNLKLYYGANAVIEPTGIAAGLLGVPDDPSPTEKAMAFIVYDGEDVFAWYAPKVSVIGGDDISLADTSALSFLPINLTPLNYAGSTKKYYVLPILIDAETAVAGSPGTFSPAGAVPPADLASLKELLPSPTTSWTTGQRVILRDGSQAHWNGTQFVAGAKA